MLDFDQRALLLLGVLKTESSHGYVVHDFIDKNLGQVANLKKPTAYATLDKLLELDLVEARTEQVGNRPPRKVYNITSAGLALAYGPDLPAGPTMILLAGIAYVVSALGTAVWHRRAQRRASQPRRA